MFLTIDTPLISSAIYSDQWPATYSEETILVHACLHLGGPSHFTGVGKGGNKSQLLWKVHFQNFRPGFPLSYFENCISGHMHLVVVIAAIKFNTEIMVYS